jgi:transcriptional regulator with XRE-family HTH domain
MTMPGELGSFLRACRARTDPTGPGLRSNGARRVAGLRREEVAVLAGVSADYYARLEQGRERNPSRQVIEAIGQALQLDLDGREHLFRLAGLAARTVSASAREPVDDALLQLMASFPNAAAYITNRAHDLLATNALTDVLLRPLSIRDNLARMFFLDPAARTFFPEWELLAEELTPALRLAAGYDPRDAALTKLIDELTAGCPEFSALWHDNSARGIAQQTKIIDHPEVGRIVLTGQVFDVRRTPGQQLVVCSAEPGTSSADALARLGALHSTNGAP